jgi:hypothetical protein
MSCHNSSPPLCPCPPGTGSVERPCAPVNFRCPVVCVPGTFDPLQLAPNDQFLLHLIKSVIDALADPAVLCAPCDPVDLGRLFCVERCSIPFTGQEVTTITVNLGSIGEGFADVKINVYEKCNTIWFKLPCALFYDPLHCEEYFTAGNVGSVSITKSPGCPEEWTGRIMLDGICYPINFKIKAKTELIAQCGCPAYLQYTFDLIVESGFQKFFHTQSITSVDPLVGGVLIVGALHAQVKVLFIEYLLVNHDDAIRTALDCTTCAIGSCDNSSRTC